MKTKELPIYGIQTNMLGIDIEGNNCRILLANGSYLLIKCNEQHQANEIKNTLLYYPVNGRDNNAREFDFEFEIESKFL